MRSHLHSCGAVRVRMPKRLLHPSPHLTAITMTPLPSARAALAMSAVLLSLAVAQNCTAPPPSSSFDYSTMDGAWYEIARIQTAGGNALQVGGWVEWGQRLAKRACALFEPGWVECGPSLLGNARLCTI